MSEFEHVSRTATVTFDPDSADVVADPLSEYLKSSGLESSGPNYVEQDDLREVEGVLIGLVVDLGNTVIRLTGLLALTIVALALVLAVAIFR